VLDALEGAGVLLPSAGKRTQNRGLLATVVPTSRTPAAAITILHSCARELDAYVACHEAAEPAEPLRVAIVAKALICAFALSDSPLSAAAAARGAVERLGVREEELVQADAHALALGLVGVLLGAELLGIEGNGAPTLSAETILAWRGPSLGSGVLIAIGERPRRPMKRAAVPDAPPSTEPALLAPRAHAPPVASAGPAAKRPRPISRAPSAGRALTPRAENVPLRAGDIVLVRLGKQRESKSLWPAKVVEALASGVSLFFFGDGKRAVLPRSRLYSLEDNMRSEPVCERWSASLHFAIAMHETLADTPRLRPSSVEPAAEFAGFARPGTRAHADDDNIVLVALGAESLWPAVVLDRDTRARRVRVSFYGLPHETTVAVHCVYSYAANRAREAFIRRKGDTPKFAAAVREADLELAADTCRAASARFGGAPADDGGTLRAPHAVRSPSSSDGADTVAPAAAKQPPVPVARIWRLARMTNFRDEAGSDDDEDTSTEAFARRHEPFELLEKAGFSTNPNH
jgi:hypothetical protein